MRRLLWFYVVLCVVLVKGGPANVSYYLNLINQEIKNSIMFASPQNAREFLPATSHSEVYGIYDYIIVGAGSAGAVIAGRLSEESDIGVLLLEAGGEETDFTDIPGLDVFLQKSKFNWSYNSTKQKTACLGMINEECPYPRGKGLGGTSLINTLVYSRGNKRDYDKWYEQGNPGWSYDEVLPFFKKSECSRIEGDEGFHGDDGNLHVEHFEPESPQLRAFLEANLELGRKMVDYNGKEQLGVSKVQFNTVNSRRDSTAKAFLKPARHRPNLKILTHAFANKILIDPYTKEAYGVSFIHQGTQYEAKAGREVIISAGAIGSPQLLMLSGIGPRKHLDQLGIPLIQDLSVGDNLHDQPTYFDLHFDTNTIKPDNSLEENVESYLHGYGPLTIAGNLQGIGFYKTKLEKIDGYPDIEMIQIPSSDPNEYVLNVAHYTEEVRQNALRPINATTSFAIEVILLRPKSRGTLRLKSKDPFDYPLIDINMFSDEDDEDIATIYEGIQLALEMLKTNGFKKLDTRLIDATVPACKKHKYLTRDYWYCQLRHLSFHVSHPVGTCKMGPDPTQGDVVDHELKVYGIENLRVADASIIPEIIAGHTNAPVIMIGEKLASLIKESRWIYL